MINQSVFANLQPGQSIKAYGEDEVVVATLMLSVVCASGNTYCSCNDEGFIVPGQMKENGTYDISPVVIEMIKITKEDPGAAVHLKTIEFA